MLHETSDGLLRERRPIGRPATLPWRLTPFRSDRRVGTLRASVSVAEHRLAAAAFSLACEETALKSRRHLLAVAVARGCRHYAPVWPELKPEDDPGVPHEALGCALLRGPADAETFQAPRCGVMVLSDLANSPQQIAFAANFFRRRRSRGSYRPDRQRGRRESQVLATALEGAPRSAGHGSRFSARCLAVGLRNPLERCGRRTRPRVAADRLSEINSTQTSEHP